MDALGLGAKYLGRILHPDIEKIRTYWQSLYKIMKRSIHFPVKFNFSLHIQLIFRSDRKRINWLLLNGTYLRQTAKPDFTAKLIMTTTKDAMLNFERMSATMLIEIVLFLFITFIAYLFLVNL